MSCHDIGLGMASVVDQIMEEVRENDLDVIMAKRLINACIKGVYWCDGNEYEALQTIQENTCGFCLEQMEPEKECLYNITDLSWDYFDEENVNYFVCENCLRSLTLCEKLTFGKIKEKCTKIKANYYFKLKDAMNVRFGRISFEDMAKKYGYLK